MVFKTPVFLTGLKVLLKLFDVNWSLCSMVHNTEKKLNPASQTVSFLKAKRKILLYQSLIF